MWDLNQTNTFPYAVPCVVPSRLFGRRRTGSKMSGVWRAHHYASVHFEIGRHAKDHFYVIEVHDSLNIEHLSVAPVCLTA